MGYSRQKSLQHLPRSKRKSVERKKKGRVCTRPLGTFTTLAVSRGSYCGVVGFGVAGLGATGFGVVGFGAVAPAPVGAGTPDCVL